MCYLVFMNTQYENEIDSCNVICPYCKAAYEPDGETFSEDPRIEECDECGKQYHLHDSWTIDHHTSPDCEINGEQHKWEARQLTKGPHDFCSVCDKCR